MEKHYLQDMIEPVVEEQGYELVRVMTTGGASLTLQVMIENKNHKTPITVDDCAKVSRALSDVLDETLNVPCTMTGRHVESYKRSIDRDSEKQVTYPASVHETWGWGELRWFRFKRRFDLVFVLEIQCFESKEDAIIAQALDRAASEFCTGYSVSGNVVCNVLTQSDYYVSVTISLIAYKSSNGTPVLLGG